MLRDLLKVSRRVTVGPQLSKAEIEGLAGKGYTAVVNLSKKGELDQALSPEEEGDLVEQAGMEYVHIPVSMSNMKHDDADQFCELLDSLDGPIYVHCRIGQRSLPFAMIYYGFRRKKNYQKVIERKEKLGITWLAPALDQFIQGYFERENTPIQ